jgi:hypothetical protein
MEWAEPRGRGDGVERGPLVRGLDQLAGPPEALDRRDGGLGVGRGAATAWTKALGFGFSVGVEEEDVLAARAPGGTGRPAIDARRADRVHELAMLGRGACGHCLPALVLD